MTSPEISETVAVLAAATDASKREWDHPYVFLLVGTSPGFSHRHQNPEFLAALVRQDHSARVFVVLIDPVYEREPPEFMTVGPGVLECPVALPELKGQVSFMYLTCNLTEESAVMAIDVLAGEHRVPVAVWSFTGGSFGLSHHVEEKRLVHIPESSCMTDTKNNSVCNPKVCLEVSNFYYLKPINGDLTYFLAMLDRPTDRDTALLALAYAYNFLFGWEGAIKSKRSYCKALETDPHPKTDDCPDGWKTVLCKTSSESDWEHYAHRASPYIDINLLREKFMQSDCETLYDYLNAEISRIGVQLVKLEQAWFRHLEEGQPGDSEEVIMVIIHSFCEEHLVSIESAGRNAPPMPSIFRSFKRMVEATIPGIN